VALGLSPRETTVAFDQLQQQPTAVIPPVAASEVAAENIAAPFKGIARGIVSSFDSLRGLGSNFGAGGGYDPETGSVVEQNSEDVQRKFAMDSAAAAQQFAPDPRKSGAAAQVLHGLFSAGTQMVGGTLLTGTPIGGAAVVGASAGVDTRNSLIANGVDKDTADKLAAGSALFSGAGALLPGGVGSKLATRILSGSGIQITAGIANRTMMHVGLEDAGYTDMAKQYMPLDGAAMMADAILGATFGAVHHMFAPEIVDSAHGIKDAEHAEKGADGPATSPESRDAILYNETRAAENLMAGRDVEGTRDVETIPDPAQEAARATAAKEATDAAAEVGARPVELPAEPRTPADIVKEVSDRVEAEAEAPKGSPLGRGARMAEAAKSEGDALAALDPDVREALTQAQAVLAQREGMKIGGEDGDINASDALRRAVEDIKDSAGEDEYHRVVAACFGRG